VERSFFRKEKNFFWRERQRGPLKTPLWKKGYRGISERTMEKTPWVTAKKAAFREKGGISGKNRRKELVPQIEKK